jgi:hypothetical protein
MQLTRTPVTNGPDWHVAAPLPRSLPTPAPVERSDDPSSLFVARAGHRGQLGTETVELGIEGQRWIARGSFLEAVSAARQLSKALPAIWSNVPFETGTLGITQGTSATEWLLSRVGSGVTDDRLSSPYEFTPATGKTPAVIRKTNQQLLAIVSPTRWIDFRDIAAT